MNSTQASIEYGVLSIGRGNVSGGGWREENIFGSQVSAVGYRVRAFRFGCGHGPEPVPDAEHLNLRPEGRDPGPENKSGRR